MLTAGDVEAGPRNRRTKRDFREEQLDKWKMVSHDGYSTANPYAYSHRLIFVGSEHVDTVWASIAGWSFISLSTCH